DGDLDAHVVADGRRIPAHAEFTAPDFEAGVETRGLLLGHRMFGHLVDGDVHHHRLGDAVNGEVAGHGQLALARGGDAGAGEGGGREFFGVEEVGVEQVRVEL